MDKLNKLKTEDLFMTEEEALNWSEWEKNTIYNDGKKEGIEQEKNENIKMMLKNNIDLDTISKISGKNINEIKEIEKSIKD